jgi:anti-sigma-K factor RskA
MAAKADRMLEILAAPDARRLDLAGRRGAPAATGQALWSRSRGVIISAVRVPPAPSGEVYQVWLTMSSGPVSLGFAAPDAQGRVGAAFDLPATVAGTVAGFHVSREPAGGSTRPQGQPVLSN